MHEITNQEAHTHSSRRDAKSANHRSKSKTQRNNISKAHNRRENMPLELISALVAVKVRPSIADKASYRDEEERRRAQPRENTLAAGALRA